MLRTFELDGSVIAFNSSCKIYVSAYSNYILGLFFHILPGLKKKVNILFTAAEENIQDYDFNNQNKTIKVNFNDEHTIFKTNNIALANSLLENGCLHNKRLGCFCGGKILKYGKNDVVIDYSIPNILNTKISGISSKLAFQHLYISPALYNDKLNLNKEGKNLDVLTTFIDLNNERRKNLISQMIKDKINHVNLENCFSSDELEKNLINSKIVVNVHQKETNQTFEELRCLPALMKGAIVISENSFLQDKIPYGNMIIWCDYKDIVKYVNHVLKNYNAWHAKIFNKTNERTLKNLHLNNINTIKSILY